MSNMDNRFKSSTYYTIRSFDNFNRLIDNCQIESSSWFGLVSPIEKKGKTTEYMAEVNTTLIDHSIPGYPKGQYHGKTIIKLYIFGNRYEWLHVGNWKFPTTYTHIVKYATTHNHLSDCEFSCIAPNGNKIFVKTTTYSSDVVSTLCAIIRHITSIDYELINDSITISGDLISRLRLKYGG